MPSIGLDFKRGRGWGAKYSFPMHSLSLGCVCFWWIAGTVADVLEQNRLALVAAGNALRTEINKQDRAAQILRSDRSKSDGLG